MRMFMFNVDIIGNGFPFLNFGL